MTASALLGIRRSLSKYLAHALTSSSYPLAYANRSGYLNMTGKTDFSMAITFKMDGVASSCNPVLIGASRSKDVLLDLTANSDGTVVIKTLDKNGRITNNVTCAFPADTFPAKWQTLLINISATDTTKTHARLASVEPSQVAVTPTGRREFRSYKKFYLGGYSRDGNCHVGEVYAADGRIDFTELLKLFVDRKGWQQDLQPSIDAGLIPAPLVHLTYKNLADLGKNSGTLADFTVRGSRTAISKGNQS